MEIEFFSTYFCCRLRWGTLLGYRVHHYTYTTTSKRRIFHAYHFSLARHISCISIILLISVCEHWMEQNHSFQSMYTSHRDSSFQLFHFGMPACRCMNASAVVAATNTLVDGKEQKRLCALLLQLHMTYYYLN